MADEEPVSFGKDLIVTPKYLGYLRVDLHIAKLTSYISILVSLRAHQNGQPVRSRTMLHNNFLGSRVCT